MASVASVSAGPGTRANIDEFTCTTSKGIETIYAPIRRQGHHHPESGRSADDHARHHLRGHPADDTDAIAESIHKREKEIQAYVPGYRLLQDPQFDPPSVINSGYARVSISCRSS